MSHISLIRCFLFLFISLEISAHGDNYKELESVQVVDSPSKFLDQFKKENPDQNTISVLDLSSFNEPSRFSDFKITELKEAARTRDIKIKVVRVDLENLLYPLLEHYRNLYKDHKEFTEEENEQKAKSLSLNRLKDYLAYIYEKPNLTDWARGLAYGGVLQSAITLYADTIRVDPDFPKYPEQTLVKAAFVFIYASAIGIYHTSYRKWLRISDKTMQLVKSMANSVLFATTLLILDSSFGSGSELSIFSISVLGGIYYLFIEGLHILEHSWLSQLSKRDLYKFGLDLEHQGKLSRLQTLFYTQIFVMGTYFFARLGHLQNIEAYYLDKGLIGLFLVGAISIAIRNSYLIVKKPFGQEFYALGNVHSGETTLVDIPQNFRQDFVNEMQEKYSLTYIFDESKFRQYLEVFAVELTKALAAAPVDAFKIGKFISDKTRASKVLKKIWRVLKPCESQFEGRVYFP